MSEPTIDNKNRTTFECGCWKAIVKRQVIDFDEEGRPKFAADGVTHLMRDNEDVEEGFCEQHSNTLVERQQQVAKMLAEGANPFEAMRVLMGGNAPNMPSLPGEVDDVILGEKAEDGK